jgi:hypothetical protein
MEDRQYANQVTKYLKRNKKTKDALVGAGVGLAGGAAAGVIAKGIHNKRNGKKFMDGAGKAALIGGGVGTVVGGVGNVALQGHLREKALAKHKDARTKRDKLVKESNDRTKRDKLVKEFDDRAKRSGQFPNPNTTGSPLVLKAKAKKAKAEAEGPKDIYGKSRNLRAKAIERAAKRKEYDEKVDSHNNHVLVKLGLKAKAKRSGEVIHDRKPKKEQKAAAKPKKSLRDSIKGALLGNYAKASKEVKDVVNPKAPEVNFSHNGNLDDKYL